MVHSGQPPGQRMRWGGVERGSGGEDGRQGTQDVWTCFVRFNSCCTMLFCTVLYGNLYTILLGTFLYYTIYAIYQYYILYFVIEYILYVI